LRDAEKMVRRVHAGEFASDWLALTDEYRTLIRQTIPQR
jgi:hypothetical protein